MTCFHFHSIQSIHKQLKHTKTSSNHWHMTRFIHPTLSSVFKKILKNIETELTSRVVGIRFSILFGHAYTYIWVSLDVANYI